VPGSRIGVVLDSFREPVKEALASAARLRLQDIEMPTIGGEIDPSALSNTGRRHLLHYVSSLGLRLSALGASLGPSRGRGADLEERLDRTRRIVELAVELRVPVVTTQLGRVDGETVKSGDLVEAVEVLANLTDRTGTFVALETETSDPQAIAALLKRIDCPTVGTCYDPGSLLMDGYDPIAGLEPLADRILIARARNAVAGTSQRPGRETALGEGQMDLAEYLAGLDQAGYRRGPFLRRTQALDPAAELADARRRLEAMLP